MNNFSKLESAISHYEKELPSLLETNYGDWVAYSESERIALDHDPNVVWAEIAHRRLSYTEYFMAVVESFK